MLINRNTSVLDVFFQGLVSTLDLSDTQIAEAQQRYEALGQHLNAPESPIAPYRPEIYPQGSFRLGTMIKPIVEDDEYDVDLVCNLTNPPILSQKKLKKLIGDRIKEKPYYEKILAPEGRRCWTLQYAEGTRFHMDILPAVPDSQRKVLYEGYLSQDLYDSAILITDTSCDTHHIESTSRWPKSNPIGYANWFHSRQRRRLDESKLEMATRLNLKIEAIPDWKVKTPLQRTVQLLKRHRDIMFESDENKPISVIICTLAAWAYSGESDLATTVLNILTKMKDKIEVRYSQEHGKYIKWIGNPVNVQENFADKWPENSDKEENFFAWLDQAQEDFEAFARNGLKTSYDRLKASFGVRNVNEALRKSGNESILNESTAIVPRNYHGIIRVDHRQAPEWTISPEGNLELYAYYKDDKKAVRVLPGSIVPKSKKIHFSATTNIKKPFQVFWQVVNTGDEAQNAGGLRGGIFPAKSAGKGGLSHTEDTQFAGTHWIECFIVKNGFCVARSKEFFVQIE